MIKHILIILLLLPTIAFADDPCVNIYFDRGPKGYWIGRTFSVMLQNLLGHFPNYRQIVGPIDMYQKGEIEKCQASFYIGSYFFSKIPPEFLADYRDTKKNVAWVGYNIWTLKDDLEGIFGYKYERLTTLDDKNRDSRGRPTFFKDVLYKGEVFFKFGDYSKKDPKQFLAPFEQTVLKPVHPEKSEVLAQSRHNFTGEILPYILRSKNHFYFADVPLSFLHESDRYLVFADLLFDILNESPKHNGKYAWLRIEDIHPLTDLAYNYRILKVLHEEGVPVNISLIPIFFDPLFKMNRRPDEVFLPMTRKPEFMTFIKDLKDQGATFIWHGVTHQYKTKKNPFSAASGIDFEFWDAVDNTGIDADSPRFVLDRLTDGWSVLQDAHITPRLWLTPHYQASALDYVIFAKTFSWNVGRAIYFNHHVQGLQSTQADKNLWYSSNNPEGNRFRNEAVGHIEVTYQEKRFNGQYFPYEIWGDIYGQRLIPENLGNSQPFISEFVHRSRTAEEIVADAKRNLVIRDSWASLFYHPFLLAPVTHDGRGDWPGDPAEIQYIIRGIKALGYKFIDINKYMDKNTKPIRPEPIYKDLEI